jgi:hypothetical protein
MIALLWLFLACSPRRSSQRAAGRCASPERMFRIA